MIVYLESEEYGYEEFHASSKDEALKIVKRLVDSSFKEFKKDNITRKVGIVIER